MPSTSPTSPAPIWLGFVDSPRNPLIGPPAGTWLIGDPTVLGPQETPDGRWHLYCNTITTLYHHRSADGYEWEPLGPLWKGIRGCVRRVGERYWLFYESFLGGRRRGVAQRWSDDLRTWSEPTVVLQPDRTWEGLVLPATSNPCLVAGPFGYRLYYSAANIVLWDTFVIEPRYVGVAEADAVTGPFRKRPEPILAPDPHHPYRNRGAGALKVYWEDGLFVGLNNGIYRDAAGRSRSAILLLSSRDGFAWEAARPEPIVAPEADGWKRALVYQLDVVRRPGEYRLYYNARDGWRRGKEHIGVAVSKG